MRVDINRLLHVIIKKTDHIHVAILKYISIIIFLFALFFASCSKDGENDPSQNKPYSLDIPYYFGNKYDVASANSLTEGGVALGRMLFYEKKLSGDNTMSCSSCHKQENAFSDGKAFSLGIDGKEGTKSTMALSNLLWQTTFFWDGRSQSLENQALQPIENPVELHQSLDKAVENLQNTSIYPPKFKVAFGTDVITAELIAKALSQFERILISSHSKYDQYKTGQYVPTDQELRGLKLFLQHPYPDSLRGGNCGDCHLGSLFQGSNDDLLGFHNNGLDEDSHLSQGLMTVTGDPGDKGKFKAPSLRNISLTAPYMHDGRFKTLTEVLDHYNEHVNLSSTLDPLISSGSNEKIKPGNTEIKLHLTIQEKQDIIAFLNMLTDDEFIKDQRFSDPFKK